MWVITLSPLKKFLPQNSLIKKTYNGVIFKKKYNGGPHAYQPFTNNQTYITTQQAYPSMQFTNNGDTIAILKPYQVKSSGYDFLMFSSVSQVQSFSLSPHWTLTNFTVFLRSCFISCPTIRIVLWLPTASDSTSISSTDLVK